MEINKGKLPRETYSYFGIDNLPPGSTYMNNYCRALPRQILISQNNFNSMKEK